MTLMSDEEFDALKLRMSIVPQAEKWNDDTHHWVTLKSAALEARDRARRAAQAMDKVDGNPDLTAEGKAKERRKT